MISLNQISSFKFIMGNKVLGRRSRSFYKGFNDRQIEYLRQKFESISTNGVIDKEKFKKSYRISDLACEMFFREVDFDEDSNIDEYEFICAVHSLCSCTIEELGAIFFRILTQGKKKLDEKHLLNFTSTCLRYNAYLEKKDLKDIELKSSNQGKFKKFDFDNNQSFDQSQFTKICLKDEDYKKWMFNMGFITQRQLDFQDEIYDLVDSDIAEEVERHEKVCDQNVDKIKRGIQHRLEDDEFQMQEQVGQQSVNIEKPWKKQIKNIKIELQNENSPSQTLQIDYVFGYRSYDCRNNVKFDSKGNVVYHQAAIGIVMNPKKNTQKFITQHHDDISCLDVVGDCAVTGEVGSKPTIIMWETIDDQESGILKKKLIVTEALKGSVGNICLSQTKNLMAAVCNDEGHRLVIYDCKKLLEKQDNPLLQDNGVIAMGTATKNIVFDVRFTLNEKKAALATLRQVIFVTFQKGVLNANRGDFGNFSVSGAMCLLPLECEIKNERQQLMLSGMGNGSVYFWNQQKCVRAVCGHTGSVSALAARKDAKSFISGDKSGLIIIWNNQLKKERTVKIPKTNCPSNMIVSLSTNDSKEMMIGTKASDIFILGINDQFERSQKIMSGHNEGRLNALALHREEPFLYTGGDDMRLIKWDYARERKIVKQRKCPYAIRTIDFHSTRNLLLVGYVNGVIQCFKGDDLEKTQHTFTGIKNPDEQALNIVKFNKDGNFCAACYQLPEFKIIFLAVGEAKMKQMSEISDIKTQVLALDFDVGTQFIRLNTDKYNYLVYDLSDPKKPTRTKSDAPKKVSWATHTIPFSPETQGIMTEGVVEEDIVCCERSRLHKNVFVIGDKYSKIKLFNYPSVTNPIFNRYVGHSNDVSGLQFSRDQKYLVSIGSEEKSIIIWKYDPRLVENQWFIEKLDAESDIEEKPIDEKRKKNAELFDEFAAETEVGEQASATKPFLGQIKTPSNFLEEYNARKDNSLPDQQISISHAFGLRNKYLKDDVRNQCKFSSSNKHVLFPTACLGVKMSIEDRSQQFYHEHKEDIVSFAIDDKRQLMATGQMAQKNPYAPRKKILAIYVWDIEGKKMLQKLDGFHTIAVVLLSFSPNSKLLFSCGNDDKNTFAVYDWMSGSILYTGPTSRAKVNGIAWKSNNEFTTCGMDHVKFWTGKKGTLGKINGKSEGMFSVISSKNVYITGSGEGGIYNWKGNEASKINAHKGKVHSLVAFKEYVYSGGDDGKILAWRTEANGEIKKCENYFDTRAAFAEMLKEVPIDQEEFGVLSIDFGPKSQCLIATKGASVILKTGNETQIIHQGHYKGELWALTTNLGKGGDTFIVTGGDDKTVRMWDINRKREVNRIYHQNKIRGMDWSNDGDKVVVADARAKIFLYSFMKDGLKLRSEITGKPFDFNKSEKNDPWVQEIKFSPDNQMITYGCHGKSMYMETLNVKGYQLSIRKSFTSGNSSAILHFDWSADSSSLSINTQDYFLLFRGPNGEQQTATGCRDTRWKTWTQKLGFPVQGIFQGIDYTDVNTVCRDPTERFMAVGYDDQCIRLFKWPAYVEKQVHRTYTGHSSHVTRIKFTKSKMVSLGGLDRTIIVWDIKDDGYEAKSKGMISEEEDDGLDDLDEDVDLPNKAIQKKPKKQGPPEEFYQVEDEGDQFGAVKPWIGAIKQPTFSYPKQTPNKPNVDVQLEYVQGYRCKDCRQNLYYGDKDTLIFHAAAVVIQHSIKNNEQILDTTHNDDILSIDYHKPTNQIITGQLGPKPLVCLFRDGKLVRTFPAPVKKGVMAVAISPDGRKAACAGMDDDHHVSVLDLDSGNIITTVKGSKKVILKIVWTNSNQFVTAGIKLYKYWVLNGSSLKGSEGRQKGNYVSIAFDPDTQNVFTGESKGVIRMWKNTSSSKPILLKLPQTGKKDEEADSKAISVVESLLVQKDYLLAGTKDGFIFVINKGNGQILNCFNMAKQFEKSGVNSEYPAVRSMDIIDKKLVVGTLGSEIYQLEFDDLANSVKKLKGIKNILKCHFSPNNTWTNQVWGLHVIDDYIFTCSDDATVRVWSISHKKLLACASLNVDTDGTPLAKDKKTNDFTDTAKGRAISVSPSIRTVVVGSKNGTVRVYSFDQASERLYFKSMFRHAKEWISDIKFAYNTLVIGSHDDALYVYDFEEEAGKDGPKIKKRCKKLKKHSSYITHFDISRDSCFMQSTCGAYQLLFWDLSSGKQITSGASMLRDERWATWTCNLGWPVQGIYPKCTDGTFINAVDRSNFSINNTRFQDQEESQHKSPFLLAAGNDNGKLAIYNYPTTIKSSKFVECRGHSSHVTNVRWNKDDNYILSVGGEDQCLMYWRVNKNPK